MCNGIVYTPTSVISHGAVLVRYGKLGKVVSIRGMIRGDAETLDPEGSLICVAVDLPALVTISPLGIFGHDQLPWTCVASAT
jgi:hypothetical protein